MMKSQGVNVKFIYDLKDENMSTETERANMVIPDSGAFPPPPPSSQCAAYANEPDVMRVILL